MLAAAAARRAADADSDDELKAESVPLIGDENENRDAIKEKNMQMLEQQRVRRERDKRRRKYEKKVRKGMVEKGKQEAQEHAARVMPFSPVKETMDPRVYEINRYTYQRSPLKTQAYRHPRLPPEFWDEEQKIEEEKKKLAMSKSESALSTRAKANKYNYGDFDVGMIGAGMGWQSPLEAMYSPAEKELMSTLNQKNPDWILLYGQKHANIKANEPEGHRWAQCTRWPLVFSSGCPDCHHPQHLFDGDTGMLPDSSGSCWSPTNSRPGDQHWIILDLRSTVVIDGFRMVSLPSVKHTVRHFRVEKGPRPQGPWEVVDYYLHHNTDMRVGANEIYSGFRLRARYLRLFFETTVHPQQYQPRVQYLALRLAEPEVAFPDLSDRSKGGYKQVPRLSIRCEKGRSFHGGSRLEIRGSNFSSCVADNSVEFFLVEPRLPDQRHAQQWYARRPRPQFTSKECQKDPSKYRDAPTVVSVHGLDRSMLGMLGGYEPPEVEAAAIAAAGEGAQVTGLERNLAEMGLLAVRVTTNTVPQMSDGSQKLHTLTSSSHDNGHGHGHRTPEHYTPCARLYEQIVDPHGFVQACLHSEKQLALLRPNSGEGVGGAGGEGARSGSRDGSKSAPVALARAPAPALSAPLSPILSPTPALRLARGVGSEAGVEMLSEAGGGEVEILEAVNASMGNSDLVLWALRGFTTFDSSLDEHGVPPERTYQVITTILKCMARHKESTQLNAWAVQALCHYAEDHGNRLCIIEFDESIGLVAKAMNTLVECKVEKLRYTDKETFEVIEEEEETLPGECEELSLAGCKFMSLMAYEEKIRDYVASLAIPACMHVMQECSSHSTLVQSQGCEALFNCIFRCEDAWNQAHDVDIKSVVDLALEMDRTDEVLMKHATNLATSLEAEGWKGRKLVEDLKLQEAHYHKEHKEHKSEWKDEKTGLLIERQNDGDEDRALEEKQVAEVGDNNKKHVHF